MKSSKLIRQASLISLFALTVVPSLARGAEVVALLSSDLSAYQQTYLAFQRKLGQAVPVSSVDSNDPSTKVIVAFGGKAALDHPSHKVTFVYCLAPDIAVENEHGTVVRVEIVPPAGLACERYKAIVPGLKTLAILWTSDNFSEYVKALAKESPRRGFSILSVHVESPGDLPEKIRSINGQSNAIWMLPDPELVKPEIFSLVLNFSKETKQVFFAPSLALVKKGATAAVLPSYDDIGEAVGNTVGKILFGESVPSIVYPFGFHTLVSRSAMERLGLRVPEDLNKEEILP